GMYNDLLRRPPSSAEVDQWQRVLAGGTPQAAVALAFARSPERERLRVIDNYLTFLLRPPAQAEIDLWNNAFLGGLSNEDMVAGFVGSPEYYLNTQKGKGNAARWVSCAYLDVLFRPASTAEVNLWLPALG